MLSISHAATGAFIAAKISNPVLAIPLILASHYLEDWILHWDVGTGLSNGTRHRKDAFLLEIVDLLCAGLLVLLLFPPQHIPTNIGEIFSVQNQSTFYIWFGAFLGLLPDFLEAPRTSSIGTPRYYVC